MNNKLKMLGAAVLSFSILTSGTFAAPTTTINPTNTSAKQTLMNINTSDKLIANKTSETLNLINTLKVKGIIKTEVYDNPSTGYTWTFEVVGDPGVIDYTFESPVNKSTPPKGKAVDKPLVCGEGTNKVLTIKGLKPGKATLKMKLIRPWEKELEAVKTMEFELLVK